MGIPWVVLVGTLGYPLLSYASSYLAYWLSMLFDASALPLQMPFGSLDYWRTMFRIALNQSVFGLLFGLLIGMALGLQKKNNPLQPI